jgi:hypothetical protein
MREALICAGIWLSGGLAMLAVGLICDHITKGEVFSDPEAGIILFFFWWIIAPVAIIMAPFSLLSHLIKKLRYKSPQQELREKGVDEDIIREVFKE